LILEKWHNLSKQGILIIAVTVHVHVPLMLTALPGCCATGLALGCVARGAWHTSTLLPQARAIGVDRAGGGAGGTISGDSVEPAGRVHCGTKAAATTECNSVLAVQCVGRDVYHFHYKPRAIQHVSRTPDIHSATSQSCELTRRG